MRTLVGIALVAIGAIQLLLAVGLVNASLADLWALGAVVLGLWLLASGLRRPRSGAVTVGLLALTVGAYDLGRQLLAWPEGLHLPLILVALGLGVLISSNLSPGTV